MDLAARKPTMSGALAKKFIVNTLSSLKKQQEKNAKRKGGGIGLHRPWTRHVAALKALISKKTYNDLDDAMEVELSERDERVKSVVTGFLVIHVLELLKVFITSKVYLPAVPLSVYLVVKVGKYLRTSSVYSTSNLGRIRIDCAFHLTLEISEWRDSPQNLIRIEVWGFQDPECHFFIGKIKEQVYQYVNDIHGVNSRYLMAESTFGGKIIYEFAFSYGCFGYGHSNQIGNPDRAITEAVAHSMFPRIAPESDDNITNKFAVRIPKRLHMMSIASFIQDTPKEGIVLSDGRKIEPARLKEPKRIVIQEVDYEEGLPIHARLYLSTWQKSIQADFNDAYGDFLCLTHRKDRLNYVAEMSNGRKCDFREMELGAIFETMDDELVQKIIKERRHTDTIIYPDDFHCPDPQKVKLDRDEEDFISKFPAVMRTTGFLWRMFGYGIQDPPTTNNDMDFPAYLDAGKTRSGGYYGCRMFCYTFRDFCRHICRCFQSCFRFFFPDTIIPDNQVPEVSVLLPSPADSTVNLYAYFIRPEEEVRVGNPTIQEIAKKSAALAELEHKNSPNYGATLGINAVQSEMTTATIKQSMVDANIVI